MGTNDSPSRPPYRALNNISHSIENGTQHRRRILQRICERGRESERLSGELVYDVWMLESPSLVAVCVCICEPALRCEKKEHRKPAPPPFAACSAPLQARLHSPLHATPLHSESRRCSAAEMRWRWWWWRCSGEQESWRGVAAESRTNNMQPGSGGSSSSSLHPTIQPDRRPGQANRPATEATDHVSWCEAMRGDSLSPIFVPCRGERGPKTCERKALLSWPKAREFRSVPHPRRPYRSRIRVHPYILRASLPSPKADFCDSRLATLFGFPAFFWPAFRLPSEIAIGTGMSWAEPRTPPDKTPPKKRPCALTVNNGRHLGPNGMCKYVYIIPKCSVCARVCVTTSNQR